ncbi:MAG: ferritin [candidate division Zixibacteria bacterium]|nr:ferritin [candidate division Zixibacteria bacterium]
MINNKIEKALNDQLMEEYASSHLYLSTAAYFKSINLDGFAHWMQQQSGEEMGHAMKFYGYIFEQQGKVTLGGIEKPQSEWASPLAAFEAAYHHEQKITGLINNLTNLAIGEKDHATNIFLHWFVTEQVEEEANAIEIIQKLKMVGDSKQGLLMLDHELGQRK